MITTADLYFNILDTLSTYERMVFVASAEEHDIEPFLHLDKEITLEQSTYMAEYLNIKVPERFQLPLTLFMGKHQHSETDVELLFMVTSTIAKGYKEMLLASSVEDVDTLLEQLQELYKLEHEMLTIMFKGECVDA